MDFAITIDDNALGSMTFDKAGDITNNIFLSLMIEKGSWFQNLDFGSRLHLLKRAKNTAHTASLAEEYCKEALQWLIDTGKATAVAVTAWRQPEVDLHRLYLRVEVIPANGRQLTFDTFVEVV
jgi:phage gp46-like protein